MSKFKSLFIFAAICGAGFFAACATKVTGLRQSDSFKYPTIITGKVAIGGVTSVMEDFPESKRNSLGNLLRTQLIEERKEYPVLPPGAIASKLGSAKYNELMLEYKNTGLLTENWFKVLKEKLGGNRFVAFARIENEDTNQDRNEVDRTNDRGQVIPGQGTVVTTSTRSVTATLSIYDLQTSEVAWSGQVTKTLRNTKEYEKDNELGLVSVIKAIKGTQEQGDEAKYPYPKPPDTNKVVAAVFAGFAENMPKKD
jgi:hypothetical protein